MARPSRGGSAGPESLSCLFAVNTTTTTGCNAAEETKVYVPDSDQNCLPQIKRVCPAR